MSPFVKLFHPVESGFEGFLLILYAVRRLKLALSFKNLLLGNLRECGKPLDRSAVAAHTHQGKWTVDYSLPLLSCRYRLCEPAPCL